ncbi:hypothetical protein [Pelagibius sp.]|uniref:hypothetical protein n=1 Tax=Pelagibius sp. TaxID=1931238 RepID=UPI003B51364D
MLTKRAITTCAAVALATVFTVQQGEHGPLVVYKLKVPKESAQTVKAPQAAPAPAAGASPTIAPATAPRATQRPATGPKAPKPNPKLSSLTPTVLGRVVMPAGARPGVSSAAPVTLSPAAVLPSAVLPAAVSPLPVSPPRATTPLIVSPLTAADRAIVAPAIAPAAGFAGPVYRSVSGLPVGESLVNEETGETLTLDAVQDVIEWRRETVDRLPQLQSTPRF